MPHSRVTIAQIAASAGVSVPTVSKVLNGRDGVAEETRQAVTALLQQHGYMKSPHRKIRPHIVDVVVPSVTTQWVSRIISGARIEAVHRQYDMVVTTSSEGIVDEHWIRRLSIRGSVGVLLVAHKLSADNRHLLERLGIPVVTINPHDHDSEVTPTVAASDWAGMREAVEHLLELGHHRIGMVTGPMSLAVHRDRADAYRSVLSRNAIPCDSRLILHGDSLFGSGYRLATQLLELEYPPSAILAGSDEQALGVCRAAEDRGCVLPRDLSVVGFDDVPLCEWVRPRLTTVHQPLEEMAVAAMRLLLQESSDGFALSRIELPAHLVVRDSTARAHRSMPVR